MSDLNTFQLPNVPKIKLVKYLKLSVYFDHWSNTYRTLYSLSATRFAVIPVIYMYAQWWNPSMTFNIAPVITQLSLNYSITDVTQMYSVVWNQSVLLIIENMSVVVNFTVCFFTEYQFYYSGGVDIQYSLINYSNSRILNKWTGCLETVTICGVLYNIVNEAYIVSEADVV